MAGSGLARHRRARGMSCYRKPIWPSVLEAFSERLAPCIARRYAVFERHTAGYRRVQLLQPIPAEPKTARRRHREVRLAEILRTRGAAGKILDYYSELGYREQIRRTQRL